MTDSEKKELWFALWCPQSSKPVTRKFTSAGQAVTVRDKMKKAYPDRDFHILVNMPEVFLNLVPPEDTSSDEY